VTAAASPSAPRPRDPYRWWRAALGLYTTLFLAFLYLPLVVILLLSFNDSTSTGFPLRGATLKWYAQVMGSADLIAAFANSMAVGAAAAIISSSLALLLALGFRHGVRGQSLVLNLILLPVLLPGIVGGVVLLIFFGWMELRSDLWTTVLVAHVNYVLPFAFLTLYPRVHGFDRALEEAAMDLGATPMQVFRHVVWPILMPAVVATALFAFTLSFDEFIRTVFVSGHDRTIPVLFWLLVVDEIAPHLPAMAVVIILVSTAISLAAFAIGRRADRAQ
jgi:ABC-type spermidine/putrescine transport system permease subunit II